VSDVTTTMTDHSVAAPVSFDDTWWSDVERAGGAVPRRLTTRAWALVAAGALALAGVTVVAVRVTASHAKGIGGDVTGFPGAGPGGFPAGGPPGGFPGGPPGAAPGAGPANP
jgi:hypothetical protein